MIRDRLSFVNNVGRCIWCWRFEPRGRAQSELDNLTKLVYSHNPILLSNGSDGWCWNLEIGEFTVNNLSKLIDANLLALFELVRHFVGLNRFLKKIINTFGELLLTVFQCLIT